MVAPPSGSYLAFDGPLTFVEGVCEGVEVKYVVMRCIGGKYICCSDVQVSTTTPALTSSLETFGVDSSVTATQSPLRQDGPVRSDNISVDSEGESRSVSEPGVALSLGEGEVDPDGSPGEHSSSSLALVPGNNLPADDRPFQPAAEETTIALSAEVKVVSKYHGYMSKCHKLLSPLIQFVRERPLLQLALLAFGLRYVRPLLNMVSKRFNARRLRLLITGWFLYIVCWYKNDHGIVGCFTSIVRKYKNDRHDTITPKPVFKNDLEEKALYYVKHKMAGTAFSSQTVLLTARHHLDNYRRDQPTLYEGDERGYHEFYLANSDYLAVGDTASTSLMNTLRSASIRGAINDSHSFTRMGVLPDVGVRARVARYFGWGTPSGVPSI